MANVIQQLTCSILLISIYLFHAHRRRVTLSLSRPVQKIPGGSPVVDGILPNKPNVEIFAGFEWGTRKCSSSLRHILANQCDTVLHLSVSSALWSSQNKTSVRFAGVLWIWSGLHTKGLFDNLNSLIFKLHTQHLIIKRCLYINTHLINMISQCY